MWQVAGVQVWQALASGLQDCGTRTTELRLEEVEAELEPATRHILACCTAVQGSHLNI